MELVNEVYRHPDADAAARRFATATAASLVFPFAPHLGAEVYERLTGARVWEEPWPDADPAMLVADTFELVCQVNGKVRDRVDGADRRAARGARALALAARGVQAHLDGHEIVKVIVVPDKLVNFVVRLTARGRGPVRRGHRRLEAVYRAGAGRRGRSAAASARPAASSSPAAAAG